MKKLSVGMKVRCISDTAERIEPGTVLTIEVEHHNKVFWFEECQSALKIHEIEPLNRTIRNVVIGEFLVDKHDMSFEIIDVGKNGVVDEYDTYYSFKSLEEEVYTIKQPEQEKQEIEKLEDHLEDLTNKRCDWENREKLNEIIEVVNKIVKE